MVERLDLHAVPPWWVTGQVSHRSYSGYPSLLQQTQMSYEVCVERMDFTDATILTLAKTSNNKAALS